MPLAEGAATVVEEVIPVIAIVVVPEGVVLQIPCRHRAYRVVLGRPLTTTETAEPESLKKLGFEVEPMHLWFCIVPIVPMTVA